MSNIDTAHVAALISGERTTFLSIGSVDAMVDFTNVDPDRVVVSPDRRAVTIAFRHRRWHLPSSTRPRAAWLAANGLLNWIAAQCHRDLRDG